MFDTNIVIREDVNWILNETFEINFSKGLFCKSYFSSKYHSSRKSLKNVAISDWNRKGM